MRLGDSLMSLRLYVYLLGFYGVFHHQESQLRSEGNICHWREHFLRPARNYADPAAHLNKMQAHNKIVTLPSTWGSQKGQQLAGN